MLKNNKSFYKADHVKKSLNPDNFDFDTVLKSLAP